MPPLQGWPVLFLVFPAFLWRLAGAKSGRERFAAGWLFGLGYFLFCFHWIGFAFLVDAGEKLWMMPFAVGGLAAAMAIYWGLAALTAARLGMAGIPLVFGWPVALATAEWLRGHLLTGFPWAAPGLAADGMGSVGQLAAVVGMPGLTLLIALWASLPFAFRRAGGTALRWPAAALLLLLPLSFAWGHWRLAGLPQETEPGIGLRIVQPNVSQDEKWRSGNARAIFDRLLDLTARPDGAVPISHVIWPESAVTFLIDESPEAQAELATALEGHKVLLTGALRRERRTDPGAEEDDIYTSIIVFDGLGKPDGHYDKWRLVPGGEFLPFEWILKPLGFRKVVDLPGSFAAGAGPATLGVPGAPPAGPLICYEAIFPHGLVDPANRPGWLVNVTNDGWFGRSVGPYQHFAQVRMRSIEQGLPVVRSANTGISGVIDGAGRVTATSRLEEMVTLDATLPKALPPTIYARFGDWAVTLLCMVLLVVGLLGPKTEDD
jgi:apolipoprotein N-acyltransferase